MILTQERVLATGYTAQAGVIKTSMNIRIYCPRVFCVRFGSNQLYSPEYGWKGLSSSSRKKLKGRTLESK